MSRDDPEWGDFVEFVRSRPASVQALMRDWPPLAIVTSIGLLVPAPGVEGEVASYFEPREDAPDGLVGVVGPVTVPHPEYGWGDAEPGMLVKAECRPDALVLLREPRWTRADVAEALA